MQTNRRTSALLAAGVLSFAAVAQAEEKANPLLTALTSTTISGYVDTSAQWNFGTGNANNPGYSFGGPSKADGFNLNVVQLSIAKPLDESEWAAGYTVDLWFGPDANTLGSQSINGSRGQLMDPDGTPDTGDEYFSAPGADFAIRQAYVALRTPIGNGIDWKVGVFDTVIGYEVLASPNNPNFTRSWGFTIEPTTHTGVLGAYKVNDVIALTAGVADTVGPVINERAHGPNLTLASPKAESYKTYLGSIALTAPASWGWAAGSTLAGGVVNGFSSSLGDNQTSWFVSTTLATPVTGLKIGGAFDYLDLHNQPAGNGDNLWVAGLYASYQATDKLSFHGRGEYFVTDGGADPDTKIWGATLTAQYDLWKNVVSRLECRWDHSASGDLFGENSSGDADSKDAVMLAANIIYKF
ncbi:MAG: porin [Verrucomicrobia bacterium]|nr:porin [Verrucomicrobiota bacterium]